MKKKLFTEFPDSDLDIEFANPKLHSGNSINLCTTSDCQESEYFQFVGKPAASNGSIYAVDVSGSIAIFDWTGNSVDISDGWDKNARIVLEGVESQYPIEWATLNFIEIDGVDTIGQAVCLTPALNTMDGKLVYAVGLQGSIEREHSEKVCLINLNLRVRAERSLRAKDFRIEHAYITTVKPLDWEVVDELTSEFE